MILRVQPQTVQRRLRAGELHRPEKASRLVRLDPAQDWLRVEDAASMLGVTPATVRAAIGRGELAGRRERGGRWRVRLESILANRRVDAEIVARFGGEAPAPAFVDESSAPRPQRLRRIVHVQIDEEDIELLERGRDRHGTIRAAVVHGLRVIDEDTLAAPGELAELRAERDLHRETAERAQARAALLTELARKRLVDELYCQHCEKLVPIEEAGFEQQEDGTVLLYHQEHGLRRGGRIRSSTVMASRRPARPDDASEAA